VHMVIKVLVYAENEEDALDEAQSVFEGLCGEGQPFDYFSTFDEGWATERWGELPSAVKVCKDLGSPKCDKCKDRFKCFTGEVNSMIAEAMERTKREFLDNLAEVKKLLVSKSDEELFEDGDFKYRCHCCGSYEGPDVWLYDHEGEGIRDSDHLKNVLEKWACNNGGQPDPELANKDIYVVPADVHY